MTLSNPQCSRCGVTAVGNEGETCRECAVLSERAHPILLDMLDVHRALPGLNRQWEVEDAVSGLGRLIADKLLAWPSDASVPVSVVASLVREWCGVSAE